LNKQDHSYITAAISISCIFVVIMIYWLRPPTRILLVRHAEKLNNTENSPLSSSGQTRAEILVGMAKNAGVGAIYTTAYCRAIQTAQPLALHLQLPIRVIRTNSDPQSSDCATAAGLVIDEVTVADVQTEIVKVVRNQNTASTILIVGHSNTVPQFIKALGLPSPCPERFPTGTNGSCNIPESQFDNLFIITFPQLFGSPNLVSAKYPLRW
jgi:broad specificity phosphatase PhoE